MNQTSQDTGLAAATESTPPSRRNPAADFPLFTENLSRRFNKTLALDSVNLRIPRGTTYGLIGLNGAGKSTLIRILIGLLPPTSGRALLRGHDPITNPIDARTSVGYVPDRPTAYPWMRIDEAIAFCRALQPGWSDDRCVELVKRFRLDITKRIGKLSKGTAAKVSLLLALAHDPEVLILDEPTDGLDPVARDDLLEGVLASVCERPRTVLMSSHSLTDIQKMTDWIGLMHEGRLAIQCPTEELIQSTKRLRTIVPDGQPVPHTPEGTILVRRDGRQWSATVRNFSQSAATAFPPESFTIEDLTLDDIFKDFVRGQQEVTT
jgi:ABC-2 type transport system ATP-binding protein